MCHIPSWGSPICLGRLYINLGVLSRGFSATGGGGWFYFWVDSGYDVKLVRYAGVVGIYFHGLFMDSNPSQATVMAPSVMLCVFQMVYTIDTTWSIPVNLLLCASWFLGFPVTVLLVLIRFLPYCSPSVISAAITQLFFKDPSLPDMALPFLTADDMTSSVMGCSWKVGFQIAPLRGSLLVLDFW